MITSTFTCDRCKVSFPHPHVPVTGKKGQPVTLGITINYGSHTPDSTSRVKQTWCRDCVESTGLANHLPEERTIHDVANALPLPTLEERLVLLLGELITPIVSNAVYEATNH